MKLLFSIISIFFIGFCAAEEEVEFKPWILQLTINGKTSKTTGSPQLLGQTIFKAIKEKGFEKLSFTFQTTTTDGILSMKTPEHRFEIKNGYHRFLLKHNDTEKFVSITAERTLKEAVEKLIRSKFSLKNFKLKKSK